MQKYVSKANVISKYFLFNYLELACKIDITFALDQNFRVRSVDLLNAETGSAAPRVPFVLFVTHLVSRRTSSVICY